MDAERGGQVFANACAGDHAAVTDEYHAGETELLAKFVDLDHDSFGIGGVAVKHLDRDRASFGVGEQAKDDLGFTGLIVPGVTEFTKRAVASLEVSGGQVVKHQGTVGELTFGEFLLDAGLLWKQPVHGLVEFGLIGGIQMERLAQTAAESVGVKTASRSQLGGGLDNAGDNHGDAQIALTAGNRIEDGVEVQVAQATERGRNVAVRQGAGDVEGIGQRRTGNWEGAGQG